MGHILQLSHAALPPCLDLWRATAAAAISSALAPAAFRAASSLRASSLWGLRHPHTPLPGGGAAGMHGSAVAPPPPPLLLACRPAGGAQRRHAAGGLPRAAAAAAVALPAAACQPWPRQQQRGSHVVRSSASAAGAAGNGAPGSASKRTGYLMDELFFWHCAGPWGSMRDHMQPLDRSPEHAETKRRLHNLVAVSGLLDQLQPLRPRPATVAELTRAHSARYVQSVAALSADYSKGIHRIGDETALSPGGYDIAALAAGGAIAATQHVLSGGAANAYVLCRPPGHHAERDTGGGYCIFNNVAIAAAHALEAEGLSRVAIVDWDVHHGNGTQQIFWEDERVLFISIHQDSNYPIGSGRVDDVGAGKGMGATLNVPLPPGSGSGAYRAAFDRVVAPALDAFAPQLILVSSGFDASYMDPLGHMMLGSEDYRYFTAVLQAAAEQHCAGRLVAVHEGGYSEQLVPFCGLAVIEQLAGVRTKVRDPYWPDVSSFGYQALQPHQDAVVRAAEAQLHKLAGAVQQRTRSS